MVKEKLQEPLMNINYSRQARLVQHLTGDQTKAHWRTPCSAGPDRTQALSANSALASL